MNTDFLKENRIHGDAMFPISVYPNDVRGTILDCHWHDELEFLTVTEGKAVFQVDTSHYNVSAGQAIFINSGELHAGYPDGDSSCSFTAVVFNPSILYSGFDMLQDKYIEPALKKQFLLPKHIKGETGWERDVLSGIRDISDLWHKKPYTYELLVKSHLFRIFSIIISNCPRRTDTEHTRDSRRTERIKSALQYIHDNYASKLSTSELSILLNLSEGHFCRLFKQIINTTPMAYINSYRIKKAVKLLEDTDKKVIEIAMEVGYDNLSYFISTFKNLMKCTPARYRNTHRNQ